jgi:lipoate-protein ligase A
LDTISDVLRVKADKIESKGIKSVRSRVTNICDYFPNVSIDDFREQFYQDMHAEKGLERYVFNEEDVNGIRKLRAEKYVTWEWNYGHSPEYNIKKDRHFDNGNLSIYMDVKKVSSRLSVSTAITLGMGRLRKLKKIAGGLQP